MLEKVVVYLIVYILVLYKRKSKYKYFGGTIKKND